MAKDRFGLFGWREFASNRNEILAAYDLAKQREQSKPVKTEHGNVGEAALRNWLKNFLPKRYDVTSGFVIPNIIDSGDQKLYHYDVIIYDQLNAPILWDEDNDDRSHQGKRRAIPAHHVLMVLEVKAQFNTTAMRDAIKKLREIDATKDHLPANYSSGIVFMELPPDLESRGNLLAQLCPDLLPHGCRGGVILRTGINADMSASIDVCLDNSGGSISGHPSLPLVKDVDGLNIYLDADGNCKMAESSGGAMFYKSSATNWEVSKMYCPSYGNGRVHISLAWSYNGFTTFAHNVLNWLEGTTPNESKHRFGYVFEHLERRDK